MDHYYPAERAEYRDIERRTDLMLQDMQRGVDHCPSWPHPKEVAEALSARLAQSRFTEAGLREKLRKIEQVLIQQTIGGSEFVGDPMRCAEAVVETLQRDRRHREFLSKKYQAERDALAAKLQVLTELDALLRNSKYAAMISGDMLIWRTEDGQPVRLVGKPSHTINILCQIAETKRGTNG